MGVKTITLSYVKLYWATVTSGMQRMVFVNKNEQLWYAALSWLIRKSALNSCLFYQQEKKRPPENKWTNKGWKPTQHYDPEQKKKKHS